MATLTVAAGLALLGGLAVSPASAAAKPTTVKPAVLGNCSNPVTSPAYPSDRLCYEAWGPSGNGIQNVYLNVYTGSDGHDHAYASGFAEYAQNAWLYLDVSHDGGRTWTGWVNKNQLPYDGGPWSWSTASVPDGPGTWVRACATNNDGIYTCTAWN